MRRCSHSSDFKMPEAHWYRFIFPYFPLLWEERGSGWRGGRRESEGEKEREKEEEKKRKNFSETTEIPFLKSSKVQYNIAGNEAPYSFTIHFPNLHSLLCILCSKLTALSCIPLLKHSTNIHAAIFAKKFLSHLRCAKCCSCFKTQPKYYLFCKGLTWIIQRGIGIFFQQLQINLPHLYKNT